MTFKIIPEAVPRPQTPAEVMLPTPHITEATHNFDAETMARHIDGINADNADHQRIVEIDPNGLTPGIIGYQKLMQFAIERYTDSMTGLLNRDGLDKWLERYKPAKFAVLFMDVRDFGEINSKYGHEMGDKVIGFIGEKMASRIRVHDPTDVQREKRAHPDVKDVIGVARDNEKAKANGFGRMGGDEVIAFVNLSNVKDEDMDTVLASLATRGNSFDTFHDEESGIDISVSIRSAAITGHKDDGKKLADYYHELDPKMTELKAHERTTT